MSYIVKDLLNEVFDKPWSMTEDPIMKHDMIYHYSKIAHDHPEEKISAVKAYRLEGNNGHLVSIVRNGMTEIHHIDKNDESGIIHDDNVKPNPRFYSTMIHHIKTKILDRSHAVRLVTPKDSDLSARYKSIAEKLKKKHNYKIDYKDDKFAGNEKDVIEIRPTPKLDLKESFKECRRMRAEGLLLNGSQLYFKSPT